MGWYLMKILQKSSNIISLRYMLVMVDKWLSGADKLLSLNYLINIYGFNSIHYPTRFRLLKKINNSCLILVSWVQICFYIFPSTSGSWYNPQIIFRKHSKCPYWVVSERDHKVFYENQSINGLFGCKSSFQNCFWNLLNTSGLSQICKIKNVWKLPIPFSRNTLIPNFEKFFFEFKNIILKKWIIPGEIIQGQQFIRRR
jgi:hypothetical protein